MNNYKVNSNKKKSCKKASLKVHAFVSATGMYLNLIPAKDKGERGGGKGLFIKEQWGRLLLSLGPENSKGYLLHCCT